jgi:hypothetical protein
VGSFTLVEYNGELITSNDVIIFGFYKDKKGKSKARDEISFFCGLFGMKVEIHNNFETKFAIIQQSHYIHKSTPRDFHNMNLEFAIQAEKDLETLKKEILSNNYSEQKFVEVLTDKTKNELHLRGRYFYRFVLYFELLNNHSKRFYQYVTSEAE